VPARPTRPPGQYLIVAAQQLILDTLRANPGGLTNKQIGDLTGLNPEVSRQKDYISWTLLQSLITKGSVHKEGRLYRIADGLA
jgi:hypothetical protein